MKIGQQQAWASKADMSGSDADSWRIAGRYIHDMGNGMSLTLSAMYEELEYEFDNVSSNCI